MTAIEATETFYIGRCKTKGCTTALRTDYRDVQDITREQYRAREFDTSRGFMIHGVQPFGLCADHGAYVLKFGRGRYSADHKCDARCINAKGPNCECSCGGHNHGASHAV